MNTTARTTDPAPQSTPRPTRRRTLRHLLATTLVTLVATLGITTLGVAGTTAPASAATSVSYCFINNYGQPLDREVTSWYAYYNGIWHFMGTDRTGTNGCSTINTYWYSHYYIKVNAGSFVSRMRGQAPLYATPGTGHVHLGTGVAWLSWV